VEGIDEIGSAGAEGDVRAADGRTPALVDPEEGLGPVLGVLAETGGALELHQQTDPKRLQRRFVEGLAAGQVADLDADVIEHPLRLVAVGF
jgi:hypothetical protein